MTFPRFGNGEYSTVYLGDRYIVYDYSVEIDVPYRIWIICRDCKVERNFTRKDKAKPEDNFFNNYTDLKCHDCDTLYPFGFIKELASKIKLTNLKRRFQC